MSKENNSKTVWIITGVILVILMIGGLILGLTIYYLNKINSSSTFPQASLKITSSSGQTFLPYSNGRYGFTIYHPSPFKAQESQNGDGVTLTSTSPSMTIRVFGSNNIMSQTLDEYLNWVRDNLYQESEDRENAREILAKDVQLGMDKIPAKERRWETVPSASGILTITDQVTFLRNDTFYTVQMEVIKDDYNEEAPRIFDDTLASFELVKGIK